MLDDVVPALGKEMSQYYRNNNMEYIMGQDVKRKKRKPKELGIPRLKEPGRQLYEEYMDAEEQFDYHFKAKPKDKVSLVICLHFVSNFVLLLPCWLFFFWCAGLYFSRNPIH